MLISLLFLTQNALAVPVQMNHQGRLSDTTGVGLTGSHLLTFTLYDQETGDLFDINNEDILLSKLPSAPKGKKIKNVEVTISLENNSHNQKK